jgi:hypothetical protein
VRGFRHVEKDFGVDPFGYRTSMSFSPLSQTAFEFRQQWFEPTEKGRVRAIANTKPDNCWSRRVVDAAHNEIFIFREHNPITVDGEIPDAAVVCITDPNCRTGAAEKPRSPSQSASEGGSCASTRRRMA